MKDTVRRRQMNLINMASVATFYIDAWVTKFYFIHPQSIASCTIDISMVSKECDEEKSNNISGRNKANNFSTCYF